MRKIIKSILSIILVISTIICATVPAVAAVEEEYICELRLVYADDYDEALEILADSEFSDYEIFDENLNEGTGEIGVWLAYKTTTDIEDAITDMAVIQENGGYREGNYQEMIKQSYEEYVDMGEIYFKAINYFMEAYDNDFYLAEAAFRQLNFYNVVSEGIPESEIPDFEGEKLGDIFYDGIDEGELATMFMQGNSYALENIRSLIAMGVAYNADGKNYLEKVGESAAKMNANAKVFANENYKSVAEIISYSILSMQENFKELAEIEGELNYHDNDFTEKELEFLETKSIAERMKKVNYLDGKTLYDYFFTYKNNTKDYSSIYPLVDALNEGQKAMVMVNHFYDVVRYSISEIPEDIMEKQIVELEEKYSENPVNVYLGADRSIYYGTYALTADAYRADSYSAMGFSEYLNKNYPNLVTSLQIAGATFLSVNLFGLISTWSDGVAKESALEVFNAANDTLDNAAQVGAEKLGAMQFSDDILTGYIIDGSVDLSLTYQGVVDHMYSVYVNANTDLSGMTLIQKMEGLLGQYGSLSQADQQVFTQITQDLANTQAITANKATQTIINTNARLAAANKLAIGLYIVGGIMLIYSAISLAITAYNYYHPDYSDVPVAMVDLIDTVDGDRYIKYDAVLEAELNDDDGYTPGDLNAYEGKHWIALYYTKSYEAGKPLLADGFYVTNNTNKPKANYTPVHRFGEVVSYDINMYNYDQEQSIYLSVKQSKNDKAAVKDIPDVIGSMFGAGFLFLAGGLGIAVGVGGTIATQSIVKKSKKTKTAEA